jgi:hypothetical protein
MAWPMQGMCDNNIQNGQENGQAGQNFLTI